MSALLRPPPHVVPFGLAALKTIASARDGQLAAGARRFLEAAQRLVLFTSYDVDALEPITPKALARALDPKRIPIELRQQLVRAMCLVTVVDGPPDPRATALVRDFAEILDVEEPGLRPIARYAEGQRLLGWLDYHRRSHFRGIMSETLEGGIFASMRAIFGLRGFIEDRAIAARYVALGELPEGTLGRALFDHYRGHGYAFPGEKSGFPEAAVYHDVMHVLGGYGTDPVGELSVAAFCAGFRQKDPFYVALLPLLLFAADINVTPIEHDRVDHFFSQPGVAEAYFEALERGSRVKVDLSDHWDFWPLLDRPLAEVRRELGVTEGSRQ